jgi:hypothetical protein
MENLKNDVIKILSVNFGEETGKLAIKFYDEDHPEELVEVAEEMMTKLIGPLNAQKQLQPVYKKYNKVIRFRKGIRHVK